MQLSRTIKVFVIIGLLFLSGVVDTNHLAVAQGSKTFRNPTITGYRLDWCLHWAAQCGKPAADAWCDVKGGKAGGHATNWKIAVDIGASTPTYVIGDKKVCNQQFCDGFQSITCSFAGGE